jgi:hypothetical protein
MSGIPMAQRCPHCGEQPMSRLQFLFIPGVRSSCRRCGRRIRLRLSRTQLLLLAGTGAIAGAAIVLLAGSIVAVAVGLVLAIGIAFAVDEWCWRRVPWLPDEAAAAEQPERPLETAGR